MTALVPVQENELPADAFDHYQALIGAGVLSVIQLLPKLRFIPAKPQEPPASAAA